MSAVEIATDITVVPSYVCGGWWTPEAGVRTTPILDASTGDPVARVATEGLDLAAVVDYARTVGRDGLAELTFHQRALALKAVAQHLNDCKNEIYEVAARAGATPADNQFDVDGGIGVLFTYASKGRRELPNARLIVDGDVEPLSRDGSFIGRHVYTRIPGVAVQINAFNFPVWGALEKFAPAFLAGIPSIVKPATPTAYVTEAAVRIMVESGLLPDGSLQLISGGGRDLLDHLDARDAVGFTGSADTAARLNQHPRIATGGVRFNAEADSLNAAILGPDAVAGTPEFDAFVKSVVTELSVKAGQKCTAIRRAIVPESLVDPVIEAIGRRIDERVVVGDPRAEGVTTGPLVSLEQLRDVRAAVDELIAGGGVIAYGSLAAPAVRTPDGDTRVLENGAFLSPIVLRWPDAAAAAVHEREAFGPVVSVLGYVDAEQAAELAARGGGSLVATVATYDRNTVRDVVDGIVGHHGRVLVLDRDDARTSTGHGAAVPHLTHGGPGRAGGGAELGGIRGVRHYMQLTGVQGTPDALTAVTGQWHRGATQQIAGDPAYGASEEHVHPFRKALDTLRLGDAFASGLRPVTRDDVDAFAETTGDRFYAHTDEQAAAANPFFPGIVAHGYLLVSWAAGLFVVSGRTPVLANYGLENLRFLTPVQPGDSIRVVLTAARITPRETDEYGEVVWDTVLYNQRDEIVATYDVLTLVAKDESQALG